ncbi:hypothetical protein HHE02_02640, partial [Helicobacter heilmannii]
MQAFLEAKRNFSDFKLKWGLNVGDFWGVATDL